jgi:hypothetical protein
MLGSRTDNGAEPMYTERNLPPAHSPWIARGSRAGRVGPGEDRRVESQISATGAGNALGVIVIAGILALIVVPVISHHDKTY